MSERRKRCFCCERLRDSTQLETVDKRPWGRVVVCRDVDDCASVQPNEANIVSKETAQ